MRRLKTVSVLVFACLMLTFAWGSVQAANKVPGVVSPSVRSEASLPPQAQLVSPKDDNKEYVLGVGDRIRLTVYGEDDLSGEYEINSTGVTALPLIGDIAAAGHTLRQFEQAVRTKLEDGYLHDPRVNAQVANYRPFFILGEVSRPGSYPYVNGMTVLNAVALAGGYTYRADKTEVTLVHSTDPNKKQEIVTEDTPVTPGDVIRVPERFF